ncbi:MAG: alanine racemase [Melioribacteraceae bacterium]|nr:alanine racemase [Melioribacteraceae bacterium]
MLNIQTPTLLLDKQKMLQNIELIVNKANVHNVILRPHVKTHQSHKIANYFRKFGIDKITVSSLDQAIYFSKDDWKDITVAFPVNILEIDKINFLASKIKLNLIIESQYVATFLEQKLEALVSIYIKIDVGYNRTGLKIDETNKINKIVEIIRYSKKLKFEGFLSHSGHSYNAKSIEEISNVHKESLTVQKRIKEIYAKGFPNLINSIGDTPTCSLMNDFRNIDEIRPGTFLFYDLVQWKIGACTLYQIAIAMACPVVAKHASRNEIIIYGGSAHFSKDFSILPSNEKYFGYVVELKETNWEIPEQMDYVKSLSQEHGIVKVKQERFQKIREGDILTILPIHSCLTGNIMKKYLTMEGEIIHRL